MPELRTDWLTGRTVLVAENRALRPNEFATPKAGDLQAADGHVAASCPFCTGNEARTPPAVYEKRDAHGNWVIRVVPNAYPAVINLSGTDAMNDLTIGSSLMDATAAASKRRSGSDIQGVHEVIIESPHHVERISSLSTSQTREVIEAYAGRLRHWRTFGTLHYGVVFKNQGPQAGASLAHVHSQLIALPLIPQSVEAEVRRAWQQFQQTGRCAYCDLVEQERLTASRIVLDEDGFVAFCPFASWQPHEVWLIPVSHEPVFELATPETLDRVVAVLRQLLERLDATVPGIQYNLLLRTAPFGGEFDAAFHWRMELMPRPNSLAGLELGTGVHINPLPPERAALQLRPT